MEEGDTRFDNHRKEVAMRCECKGVCGVGSGAGDSCSHIHDMSVGMAFRTAAMATAAGTRRMHELVWMRNMSCECDALFREKESRRENLLKTKSYIIQNSI